MLVRYSSVVRRSYPLTGYAMRGIDLIAFTWLNFDYNWSISLLLLKIKIINQVSVFMNTKH